MISYEEALKIVRAEAGKICPAAEITPLPTIPGRVCAETLRAPTAHQPFDNSAMDGYALRAEDIATAVNDNPVLMEVAARIAAGDGRVFKSPQQGQCYEIMTGAPLPPGCDAVVPVEETAKEGARVRFTARVENGDNVRRAGEDFAAGDVVTEKGTVLTAEHILALATLGINNVKTYRKPAVSLISTGQEVVDDLSADLKQGQIYNSTKPYLEAALAEAGADVLPMGTVADDPQVFRYKILDIIDRDVSIAVSTGAVSAGTHDFVPSVLKDMGAEIFFHKVAVRPGKPLIFARLPGGTLFFGLPGNPAASAAGFRFFIRPALCAMQGLPPGTPQYAALRSPFKKNHGLTQFVRARISSGSEAILCADIPPRQQSFMVRPFTDTNGWAVISGEVKNLAAGEKVEVIGDGGCVFYPCTNGIRRC